MISRTNKILVLLVLAVLQLMTTKQVFAQADCARATSQIELDINNVRTTLHNGGDMWWTVISPSAARYEIPKQDNPSANKSHSLFAGSVWLGGVDQNTNELLVIASTYRQSHYALWPGPVLGSGAGVFTNAETCLEWDRQFKVNRDEIAQFLLDFENDKILKEEDIPESIRFWPGRNNPFLQGEISDLDMELAPFIEMENEDGIYNPLDGDIPDIKGDQSIWWVMNDIGNQKEFGGVFGGAAPIGMEIQVLAHAFATDDPLNDATLYNYRFINKSHRDIAETHISQWADPDLGFSGDDYVQSDVGRGLAICFNGDDFDESIAGYGDKPPAIGIDFFSGPLADFDTIGDGIDNDGDGLIDEADNGFAIFEGDSLDNDWDGIIDEFGERISMSNFLYYNSNSNPVNSNPGSAQDFFNYTRTIWRDGSSVTHDLAQGTQQNFPVTNYFFPGNSWQELSDRLGNPDHIPSYSRWDEFISGNQPADRRFLPSIGAFSMEPGALVEYTVGVPWAQAEFGGSRASFDKLLCADDYIQCLYYNGDIQFLNGPDAPDVAIRELENEIRLNLVPAKMNVLKNGRLEIQNTEIYSEDDIDIGASYDFEGYLVYQLIDENVDPSEYKNPDEARLIYQCDIENGIGQITNFTPAFESRQCYFNASVEVQGLDKGIQRSISIKEDAFDENSKLVNNKEYYYSVIAYGFNKRANELNQLSNLNERVYQTYIESKKNIKVYKAIPHAKPGSIITENAEAGFTMKLISGKGNGGNELDIIEGIEDSILTGKKPNLIYQEKNSPLNIYRYDPFAEDLPDSVSIYLTSRLEYDKLNSDIQFFPGDTIVSSGDYISQEVVMDGLGSTSYTINPYKRQQPGLAIVIAELENLETDETKTLEIRLLNEPEGGTFIRDVIEIIVIGGEESYKGVTKRPTNFHLKNDTSSNAICTDFENNDFWNVSAGGRIYKGSIPISENREELIPELGLSFNLKNAENPGYKNKDSGFEKNGFIAAEIKYSDLDQKWLVPINFDSLPWISQAPRSLFTYDQLDVYQDVLEGSWSTWLSTRAAFADESIAPGVDARNPEGWAYIQDLPNVDIVFTQDRNKWTRCPVLQMAPPKVSIVNPVVNRVQKSEKLSVDKDGNPDASLALFPDGTNTISKGYSWFPGYAIDLDKGIRLNMAFTENKLRDSIIGDDLLYNPNSNDTNNHYVIVANSEYDFETFGGSKFQRVLDSTFLDQSVTRTSQYRVVYEEAFSWIGMMKISKDFESLPVDKRKEVRIKLRVNREYAMTEAGVNPEWKFKLNQNTIFSRFQMSEELNKIRIVPNPYILGSNYENTLEDTKVKITHLPPKCKIAIHGIDGSLIKSFNREFDESFLGSEGATQIWDLTNESFQPINSGVYLIHVEADEIGEFVRKFFYVKRIENISYDF
ncbi:MAG: hypothetical protein RLN79_12010 [Cytophagales bacterium]